MSDALYIAKMTLLSYSSIMLLTAAGSTLQKRTCTWNGVSKEMGLPVERCLRPWLEPVNDSRVDGGQEALTSHTEIGSYRTGCEDHV